MDPFGQISLAPQLVTTLDPQTPEKNGAKIGVRHRFGEIGV
ncbi:MAG TPA: hypothetical protein VN634_01335 [Candidatus Limnocylindrales bacterium]|nr:hypothetical protein [Candidatus Limnocylindrales bacterium]